MSVTAVDRLDLRLVPRPWRFAEERRMEIDAHFAAACRGNPRLWNGRVLLLHHYSIETGVLHGSFFETDYASLHAWLAWNRPAAGAWDCFGSAAVAGNDGAFLLGRMAAHTANAGRIYFPCGTPDLDDVKDSKVDFEHSIARELAEETGLEAQDFTPEPRWTIVEQPARLVAFRVLRASVPGEALRQKVLSYLAQGGDDELDGVHLVRGPEDLSEAIPDYAAEFLRSRWR
jgi:8-oxo-dGTP pyrophosphatase MutT (NUDIX family)